MSRGTSIQNDPLTADVGYGAGQSMQPGSLTRGLHRNLVQIDTKGQGEVHKHMSIQGNSHFQIGVGPVAYPKL